MENMRRGGAKKEVKISEEFDGVDHKTIAG